MIQNYLQRCNLTADWADLQPHYLWFLSTLLEPFLWLTDTPVSFPSLKRCQRCWLNVCWGMMWGLWEVSVNSLLASGLSSNRPYLLPNYTRYEVSSTVQHSPPHPILVETQAAAVEGRVVIQRPLSNLPACQLQNMCFSSPNKAPAQIHTCALSNLSSLLCYLCSLNEKGLLSELEQSGKEMRSGLQCIRILWEGIPLFFEMDWFDLLILAFLSCNIECSRARAWAQWQWGKWPCWRCNLHIWSPGTELSMCVFCVYFEEDLTLNTLWSCVTLCTA